MTEANMPAEAGIVDRAVSFTRAATSAREPVARLHYKGRPNRHLRGLKPADRSPTGIRSGSAIVNSEKSARGPSPHRAESRFPSFARRPSPAPVVTVETEAGEVEAEVVELPFIEGSGI